MRENLFFFFQKKKNNKDIRVHIKSSKDIIKEDDSRWRIYCSCESNSCLSLWLDLKRSIGNKKKTCLLSTAVPNSEYEAIPSNQKQECAPQS